MPRGRKENLRVLTTEEARKIGSKGGKKSVKVRREKKLLSQIYADMLADQSGIAHGKGFQGVVAEILNNQDPKNNPSRVALIKEVREATEGSKSKTETTLNVNIDDANVADIMARHGVSQSKN